jgi:hypothetical protein
MTIIQEVKEFLKEAKPFMMSLEIMGDFDDRDFQNPFFVFMVPFIFMAAMGDIMTLPLTTLVWACRMVLLKGVKIFKKFKGVL